MTDTAASLYSKDLINNFTHGDFVGVIKDILLILSTLLPHPVVESLTNFFHSYPTITSYLPTISFIIFVLIAVYIIRLLLSMRKTFKEQSVLLELTPPAMTEKTAYTTQQLFAVIHDELKRDKTIMDRLLGRKIMFSFEIVSTKNEGIRYLIRTTPDEVNNVKRYALSYLPQVHVKIVNEYLPKDVSKLENYHTKVVEFKLRKHFAYPLQAQAMLKEHDPVAYITGMMTKLAPGELIVFQIVISPTKVNETEKLSHMILNNEDILSYLNKPHLHSLFKPLTLVFKVFIKIATVIGNQLQWAVSEFSNQGRVKPSYVYQSQYQMPSYLKETRPARLLSIFEEEAVKSVQDKVDQSLFETSVRLLVVVKDKKEQKERIKGFSSSLATFSVPKYQSLNRKYNFPPIIMDKLRLLNFRKRLLSLFLNKSSSLLSVSEVADLYHFPFTRVTQTENIVKVHSKELPAPLSLKQNIKFDVILGANTFGGETTPIGLTEEIRKKHQYLIGGTGMGKSTMMLYQVTQDINKGRGVCFIDPHGDTAEAILNFIPEERKEDLIYFDSDDLEYPVGLNLLELTPGLSDDDAVREKQFKMEAIISLFHKTFSGNASTDSHRIDYILRNVIQTAFTIKDRTVFTLFQILNNPGYQKEVIAKLEDEQLKDFWKNEFGKAGDYQRVKMAAGVTSKIGRFLFTPSVKRVLEQPKSTINFDDIINQGKILICNFSKGNIGEENSELFGTMVLTQLQIATQKRSRMAEDKRKDFYIYVDEFQNFATPSFAQMLSESRKYRVYLTIAEQSTSQQKDQSIVSITMANVGTIICFRTGNEKDEEIMLHQFSPYIKPGEIMNLPRFKFYMKISAVEAEEPFSGQTLLSEFIVNNKKITQLKEASRKNYTKKYEGAKQQKEIEVTGSYKANKTDPEAPKPVVSKVLPETRKRI